MLKKVDLLLQSCLGLFFFLQLPLNILFCQLQLLYLPLGLTQLLGYLFESELFNMQLMSNRL